MLKNSQNANTREREREGGGVFCLFSGFLKSNFIKTLSSGAFIFLIIIFFLFFLTPQVQAQTETSDPLPEQYKVYTFDQIGSNITNQSDELDESGKVKGISTVIEKAKPVVTKVVVPIWETVGVYGFLAIGVLGILIWLILHLRYRHEKYKYKHISLKSKYIHNYPRQTYTLKDNFLILFFHPVFKVLRFTLFMWLIFSITMGSVGWYFLTDGVKTALAADFVDDTADEFNTGSYNETQWDAGNSWMELTDTGKTNGSGDYTSGVKGAGGDSTWNSISWTQNDCYGCYGETFYANYEDNINGTWGEGDLTGTPTGGAATVDGKLDLTHDDKRYVTYDAVNNADSQQTGCIRFEVTPNYSGNPSSAQYLFAISAASDYNLMTFYHWPDGTTYLHIKGTGPNIIFAGMGVWNPTAGQEYEFELNYDLTEGTTRIFIDGVQFGPTKTETGVRSDDITYLRIGTSFNKSANSNFKIDDLVIFDKVQHTSNYNAPSVLAPCLDLFARSCDDALCDTETWTDLNNTSPQDLSVADNQYFQYKYTFETDDSSYSPELKSVTVDYTLNNTPPDTPSNSLPINGAMDQDLNVTLEGSAYSDPDSDPQIDAGWQVDDNSNFATPVWTKTAEAAETTTTVNATNGTFANELAGKTELDHNTTYYWRVRYNDGTNWSEWSTATNFTTNNIQTPTNQSPANGATVTTLTPLLEADAFVDPQNGHTHSASWWQVDDNSNFSSPEYDSGETASGETSRAVPGDNLNNFTTYYWHVRYKDSSGFWSEYSATTNFEISVTATAVEVRPVFGNTTVDQGDTVKIDVQVINFTDGSPLNNTSSIISIYNPSGSKIVTGDNMSYVSGSNGIYRYSYNVPTVSGSYLYEVTAVLGNKNGYAAANFEVRTIASDITDIKSDVSYIRTQIDSLHTKVDTIDTNIDTLIDKWKVYSASDIINYIDDVESRLGNDTDTCIIDDTIFGNIQCIQDKWGTQTADAIYTTAYNAYTTIQNVQTELGYNGKTDTAYDDIQTLKGYVDTLESGIVDLDSDLVTHEASQAAERTAQSSERTAQAISRTKVENIQTRVTVIQNDVSTIKSDVSTIKDDISSMKSTLDNVSSKLQEISNDLSSNRDGVYNQLVDIANQLSTLEIATGSGVNSLYSISTEMKNDVRYLRNKILDFQALIEINQILLTGEQNSILSTWYTFGSVILNMIIANPTDKKTKIPFKTYLPKEIKQEHVISDDGLKIEYDEISQSLIASGEFELAAGESITRQIEMKDIWRIDENELENLKQQADILAKDAEKTSFSAQIAALNSDIKMRLERILRKQKDNSAIPQDHILSYMGLSPIKFSIVI